MIKPEMLTYIKEQNENRRLWVEHDTPESVAAYIRAETHELWDAIQESFITGDVFGIASEVGDILYLISRYKLSYGKLPEELTRLENEVLDFCEDVGLEPNQCVKLKLVRNAYKYTDHIMSNGRPIKEATRVSKDVWAEYMGGDEAFSHAYLDVLAHTEEVEHA